MCQEENEQYPTSPLPVWDSADEPQKKKRPWPRKLYSKVKVDRWWFSGLSLIILSEIMQKTQQHSLKGIAVIKT